jgi:hypothetical protein
MDRELLLEDDNIPVLLNIKGRDTLCYWRSDEFPKISYFYNPHNGGG